MLQLPPSTEPLRVVSLDPGTSTMGVALLTWDIGHSLKVVEQAFTLQVNDRNDIYQSMGELHGNRHARLFQQGERLLEFLYTARPHVVISEAPYMGSFPQSFMALTEALFNIRQFVMQYDAQLPFYSIDPITAKKTVGVKIKRHMEKEDVRVALLHRSDLHWMVDPNLCDEHSIDAVAVGLYYLLAVV